MQAFINPDFWEECISTAQPFDVEHWITQVLVEYELLADSELQTCYYQSEAEQSTYEQSYIEQQTNSFQPQPALHMYEYDTLEARCHLDRQQPLFLNIHHQRHAHPSLLQVLRLPPAVHPPRYRPL